MEIIFILLFLWKKSSPPSIVKIQQLLKIMAWLHHEYSSIQILNDIEWSQNKQAQQINKTWEAASCVRQGGGPEKRGKSVTITMLLFLLTVWEWWQRAKGKREGARERVSGGANKGSSVNSTRSRKAIFASLRGQRQTDTQTDRQTARSVQCKMGTKKRHASRRLTTIATIRLNCGQKLNCCTEGKCALKMGTSCLGEKPTDAVT